MSVDFYKSHLERVSRSFSFCIAQLEGDLKSWVSLSYLLCRILDTVEDAPWMSDEAQAEAYLKFQEFLKAPVDPATLQKWIRSFPAGLPDGEALLLAEAETCFERFHALPERIRAVMQTSILNMYRGMRFFSAERKSGAGMRLRNIADVNQYCFFVAGVVGDLLTNLLAGASQASKAIVAPTQLLDAHHFGLFLQKVNLLKDQKKDEQEGRHLVAPSRQDLLASVAVNAEGAIRYITSLPISERGYRTFCAWSLFLGLSSLRWMERTTLFGSVWLIKPPKLATRWVLQEVASKIDDNEALKSLFRRRLPKFPAVRLVETSPIENAFLSFYEGPLGRAHFQSLGMLKAES